MSYRRYSFRLWGAVANLKVIVDLRLKSLTSLTFIYPKGVNSAESSNGEQDPLCPSCKKGFSNTIIMFCESQLLSRFTLSLISAPLCTLTVIKPCTHVVCKTCAETLVKPSMQCVVCDEAVTKNGIIELRREGTGFAGGGIAETSRAGVAFQG